MYLHGFGNHHQSEAVKGALPTEQNSPQICNYGLYAEQLSGTSFTRARHQNSHSWLYRILPSAAMGTYYPFETELFKDYEAFSSPNATRWSPLDSDHENQDFIESLYHVAGSKHLQTFMYRCQRSMENRYFADNDGELLFIPYQGEIKLLTEFGILDLKAGMIAVIPRGVTFKIQLCSSEAKGYLCENSGALLTLPQLGPIGANGLANPRHFQYPTAAFEHDVGQCTIICKHDNKLWTNQSSHSPLNVVAWHGNYAPYSYDLSLFNTINTVSFDHPDPSLFTVLTSESDTPGVANLDFVIFPPRWMVGEHTFRPPYFHRNYMNELMGLISGEYDAKKEGFVPGGISIHNCMTPHGPDYASYEQAINKKLEPEYYANTLAFMLETRDPWKITQQAMNHPARQDEYLNCWQGFKPARLK